MYNVGLYKPKHTGSEKINGTVYFSEIKRGFWGFVVVYSNSTGIKGVYDDF